MKHKPLMHHRAAIMNILMLSNTFTPHVGGVARSLERFTEEYRSRGHRVIVVAPEFEGTAEREEDVIRMLETEWEIWVNRAHAAGAALHTAKSIPPRSE